MRGAGIVMVNLGARRDSVRRERHAPSSVIDGRDYRFFSFGRTQPLSLSIEPQCLHESSQPLQ